VGRISPNLVLFDDNVDRDSLRPSTLRFEDVVSFRTCSFDLEAPRLEVLTDAPLSEDGRRRRVVRDKLLLSRDDRSLIVPIALFRDELEREIRES
jgi:hypothetical protein